MNSITSNVTNNIILVLFRLCLLSWSDDAKDHFRPGQITDKAAVINAMSVTHTGGGTNTEKVLDLAREVFRTTRRTDRR